MAGQYESICKSYGCKAKVFTKESGALKKKIGSPDLLVLFTNTVSHKMVTHQCNTCNALPAAYPPLTSRFRRMVPAIPLSTHMQAFMTWVCVICTAPLSVTVSTRRIV